MFSEAAQCRVLQQDKEGRGLLLTNFMPPALKTHLHLRFMPIQKGLGQVSKFSLGFKSVVAMCMGLNSTCHDALSHTHQVLDDNQKANAGRAVRSLEPTAHHWWESQREQACRKQQGVFGAFKAGCNVMIYYL